MEKQIAREGRFFIHDNRIVTGSLYLDGDDEKCQSVNVNYRSSLIEYLETGLAAVSWQPEPLHCIDLYELYERDRELFVLALV